MFCNEMSIRVTSEAVQLHGGYGFTDEYLVSRLYRGARYGSLGGGASETLRDLIGRKIVDRPGARRRHPGPERRARGDWRMHDPNACCCRKAGRQERCCGAQRHCQSPEGVVAGRSDAPLPLPGAGPWVVKAQVPVGGRGKAGGVVLCKTPADVDAALKRLIGAQIKGHQVRSCLIEAAVTGADEYYLSLIVDPAQYGVRVTLLREGGVDVEQTSAAAAHSRLCAPEHAAIAAAIRELAAHEPSDRSAALIDTGEKLARLFLERELMLAEINPLFVGPHGCVAGDAKIVVDLNAVQRQPASARPDRARRRDLSRRHPQAQRRLRLRRGRSSRARSA